MKENKHIEKELLFKNNIKDITSISLDSDYKVISGKVMGNFLISGDYKVHEVSLNRESFNFKIPFSESIDDDIDLDTVKVEISNFIYDYKKDELIVSIDYLVTGDRKDVFVFDDEESLDEFLKSREVELVDTRISDIKEELDKDSNKNVDEYEKVEVKQIDNEQKSCKLEDKSKVEEEILLSDDRNEIKEQINELDNVSSDDIISNVNTMDDGFVTYKVYKIKENETLESIVIKYKTTIDELKEYNDLNSLSVGDKIIIPSYE